MLNLLKIGRNLARDMRSDWAREIVKQSPLRAPFRFLLREWHRYQVHASQDVDRRVFFTLSPMLPIAIHRAYLHLAETAPDLLKRGAYYEFGVYRGYSLWAAERLSREYAGPTFDCYGFDSFTGLPDYATDVPKNGRGKRVGIYAASIADVLMHLVDHGANMNRISLFPGVYSAGQFADFVAVTAFLPPAIVTVDCDLYKSTWEVLRFMRPRLQVGTVLLFDDFYKNGAEDTRMEALALREWREVNPDIDLAHLFDFGGGAAFQVRSLLERTSDV